MAKWKLPINFKKASLNSALNGAEIADNELQKATDVIFDNGVLEKAPGRAIVGTAHGSGASIDCVHRAWDKLGNKTLLRFCNGEIERWTGAEWTDVVTGLTAGVRYDCINANDKALIVNGYDEAREFDPSDNSIGKLGIEPPRFYKKVAYFESDETSLFTLGSYGSFNTSFYRIEERTGTTKRSLKLTAPTGTTQSAYITYGSAQDFSQYANGISISNNDFFVSWILHRTRAYVNYITIDFITSTGNYYRFTIEGTDLDQENDRDNVWTEVKLKKAAGVATGSPNWASITKVTFSLTSQTGEAEVYFDNCHFKNPPIEAHQYSKIIDLFEGPTSNYTVTNGTIAHNSRKKYIKQGSKSLKVTITGAQTCTIYDDVSAIDLTQFIDGISTQASDNIAMWVWAITSNLTSITMKLFSDVTPAAEKYFYKTFTVAGGDFNASGSGGWSELADAKGDFTDSGTADWSAIIRIQIEIVTTGNLTAYLDDWSLREPNLQVSLADMENDESWAYGTSGSGGFNTNKKYLSEGDSSIYLTVPKNQSYTVSLDLGSTANLTQYSAGVGSATSDLICFWMFWTNFSYIKTIKLQVDINLADWSTDYFEYEFTPDEIERLMNLTVDRDGKRKSLGTKKTSNKSLDVEIEKVDFTRVGTTGAKGWDTVEGYRFVVETTEKARKSLNIYFDNLHMRRRRGLTGIYQWMCVFRTSDNKASGHSEWSEQVTFRGTKALLRLLPISADTNIGYREIYRKGGDLGEDARLDFTIYDNTTTEYWTETPDSLLGKLLNYNVIPNGTIRVPVCAKWGPVFKGRYILYQDPTDLRAWYYSLPDLPHAWSELQKGRMDSDILNIYVMDDILYFNTKNGVKSLSIDPYFAGVQALRETGIVNHSMGPWASCKVEEGVGVISYDGVYLFSGNSHSYISEGVKDHFDSASYDLDQAIIFYRKRHLFVSVITTGGVRSLLDIYLTRQGWRKSDYIVNCFCLAEGIGDNSELYAGDLTGSVYQLDTGYASSFEVITKDYPVSENRFEEVSLSDIWVMARSDSALSDAINIQFRINQELKDLIIKPFPTSNHLTLTYKLYHAQLKSVERYLKGSKIGLRITPATTDKHFAIEAILLAGETSGLPEVYERGINYLLFEDGDIAHFEDGSPIEDEEY